MKRTFIAAALALSVGAAFANPDAVVIGAGGAGLSAAVTLHDLGREVVVLEKMPMIGGNTVRAEGGINAAETPQQKKAGIPDTIDQFYADTMKGGHNLNDPALVRTLTTHAKDAVAWLVSLGADLNTVGRAGGAKYPRAHRPTDGSAIGPEVIRVLWKAAKDRKMDVRTQTRATEIIMKDGRTYQKECFDLKGSPQNPVGFTELLQKFKMAASGLLPSHRIQDVLDRCSGFDQEKNLEELIKQLNW